MSPLFSQHPSNPLEAPSTSEDRFLHKAAALLDESGAPRRPEPSSDDPLGGYAVEGNECIPSPIKGRVASRLVEQDDDMESEDELALGIEVVRKPFADAGRVKRESDLYDDEEFKRKHCGHQANGDADMTVKAEEDFLSYVEYDEDEEEDDAVSANSNLTDDEENTIYERPSEERDEIFHEIAELEERIPDLTADYRILDRLGTGTFSSVYKAIDLGHQKWDNTPWLGRHPPSSSAHYQSIPQPPGSTVYVAIKRIYVTSSPERIRNEIVILEECRGCRHISQLITAFRRKDQVVIVMPYQRNEDFRVSFPYHA